MEEQREQRSSWNETLQHQCVEVDVIQKGQIGEDSANDHAIGTPKPIKRAKSSTAISALTLALEALLSLARDLATQSPRNQLHSKE